MVARRLGNLPRFTLDLGNLPRIRFTLDNLPSIFRPPYFFYKLFTPTWNGIIPLANYQNLCVDGPNGISLIDQSCRSIVQLQSKMRGGAAITIRKRLIDENSTTGAPANPCAGGK
jgi:hypothetical protein